MAASLHVYQYFVVDINGQVVKGGSLTQPKSIALGDGEVIDRAFKVAASGIVKIFDAAEDEALGGFDFCWLEADLDVEVQLTTDAGTRDDFFVVELKGSGTAGEMGPALVLGSDLAHQLDGSVDLFDGTEDTIDEIWAKNPDSTNAARVRIVVAT